MGIGQQQEETKKKEVTKQDRDRLIDAYENDEDLNAVITALKLKKDTAYRILKRYIKTGERYARKRGGRTVTKATEEMQKRLEELVEENKDWTLQEYATALSEEGFPTVHYTTIGRHLHCMMYSVKKMGVDPAARNSTTNKNKRKDFCTWLMNNHDKYHCVWVDETGIFLVFLTILKFYRV